MGTAVKVSREEYLEREEKALTKNEYRAGEIVAMAGASPNHIELMFSLGSELRALAKPKGCRLYGADLRLRIERADIYTYPDLAVACGSPRFNSDRPPALLNPVLIAEVLSASTQDYDRGEKFAHYRTIPSFREYLLVSADEARVEHYWRDDPDAAIWHFEDVRGRDVSLRIRTLEADLSLARVYELIEFDSLG